MRSGRLVMEPDLRSTDRGFESRPLRCRVQPWTNCLHTCASVTRQYNLVPANGWWYSAAGEVTAGLVESKQQPTAGFMASVTCVLTADDLDHLRNPTYVAPLKLRLYGTIEIWLLLLLTMPKASPIQRARKQEISWENVNAAMTVSRGGLPPQNCRGAR